MPEETDGYGLVMPFVTVVSAGGPHDDESYTAGWEMGALDNRLAGSWDDVAATIRTANRAQADLIAMRHGYITEVATTDSSEWLHVLFRAAGERIALQGNQNAADAASVWRPVRVIVTLEEQDALPVGSFVKQVSSGQIYQRTSDGWIDPNGDCCFDLDLPRFERVDLPIELLWDPQEP